PVPSPSMCDASTSVGLCYAFSEPADAATKSNQADQFACRLLKGKFMAMAGCPRSNAFGRCSILEGKAGSYLLYYYPANKVDLASAKADCENPKSGVHAQVAGAWLPF
ncbi:MAG TPA: hypothetical protein VL588_05730, partial [Bdellovibrionota bacterium]|nr:hypothetical protein [Bdellovibrionota bacterium]